MMFNSDFFKSVLSIFPSVQGSVKTSGDALETAGSARKTAETAEDAASAAKKLAQQLEASQLTRIPAVTGADGTFKVDYSALKLKSVPGVIMQPRLAQGDAPVSIDIVGEPTATSCVIRVRRMTSIVGLLPSWSGVAGVKVDVYVRPVVT